MNDVLSVALFTVGMAAVGHRRHAVPRPSRGNRPMNDVPSVAVFMAGMAAGATAVMLPPGLLEATGP